MNQKEQGDWLDQKAKLQAGCSYLWDEMSKTVLIAHIEYNYKSDHIRNFGVSDVVPNGDGFLIKWYRRIFPLDDEQLAKICPDFKAK